MAKLDILIIDDEIDIRKMIQGILEDEDYLTRGAKNSDEAYQSVTEKKPDLIILDIWLQGSQDDGLQILEKIKTENKNIPIVMISGHGTIETAVTAIKMGAYDFIEKPFKSDRLLLMIERALENANLRKENAQLKQYAESLQDQMVASSPIAQNIKNLLNKAAPTNSRVLITGEIGTGKNLAARYLYANSKRADKAFLILNCATVDSDKMEDFLFGDHSLIKNADGGTLLLDEVLRMSLDVQSKFLRFLQEGTFQPLGTTHNIPVDVRVIATTSENVNEAVSNKKFRQDLLYRLNVVQIEMPSLREQKSEIPDLVTLLLSSISKATNIKPSTFSARAMSLLQSHNWAGNVRQLRNVLEWVVIMSGPDFQGEYTPDHLPPEITGKLSVKANEDKASDMVFSDDVLTLTLREAREKFEHHYLMAQVKRFEGNISKTAQFVGMERSALHRKLKTLDVLSFDKEDESISAVQKKIQAQ